MSLIRRFISNLFEPKSNGPEIAAMLASLLQVNVSETTLQREIEEHPDYPSLLSVSDILKSFGVENLAIRISEDKLTEIPLPFIAQIQGEESAFKFFTIIKEINNKQLHYFDPEKHQWAFIDKEDFLLRFSGVILLVSRTEKGGELDYTEKVKAERHRIEQLAFSLCLPLLIFFAGLITFYQFGTVASLPVIFSLFTLSGCVFSALLLWYEVDQYNPALNQICNSGTKVDCGAVLDSKASKIAGISWSSIGFTYFMGLLLLSLFLGLTNPLELITVSWLNVLALPYVVFSIYYQWRVVKQWCVMCLGVQLLLCLQFITAFVGGWHSIIPLGGVINSSLLLQVITAFVVPFVASSIALHALQNLRESRQTNIKLQKLKHNPEIFEAILSKQKILTESPADLGIILGKADARYKIIKVCNPYCPPCAKAHKPIEALLHNNSDVQVQILFNATNDPNDNRTPPIKHFLAIAEKKDYQHFAKKYPMNGELNRQSAKIDAMKDWCDRANVEVTPTFFISFPSYETNNHIKYYQLPDIYDVNDLKYFVLE